MDLPERLDELDPILRPLATIEPGGRLTPGANNLVRAWNASPQLARLVLETNRTVRESNRLGPRLTELIRLSVAHNTRCRH